MSEKNKEKVTGMTIKELKIFLNRLPEKFDDYGIVNGEVAGLEGDYYVRIDKPVIHLEIDEDSAELMILHQSEEELQNIMKQINGDTEKSE